MQLFLSFADKGVMADLDLVRLLSPGDDPYDDGYPPEETAPWAFMGGMRDLFGYYANAVHQQADALLRLQQGLGSGGYSAFLRPGNVDWFHFHDPITVSGKAMFPPDHVAVRSGWAALNHGDLDRRSQLVASYLARIKDRSRPEALVGIALSSNRPEFFEISDASKMALMQYSLFPYYWDAGKIMEQVRRYEFRALFVDAPTLIKLKPYLDELMGLDVVVIHLDNNDPDVISYGDILERTTPAQTSGIVDSKGVSTAMFTSGTTGAPKMIRREGEVRTGDRSAKDIFGLSEGDRHLVTGPLFHAASFTWAKGHMNKGATLYLAEKFDPRVVLETIEEERITTLFLVPTMVRRLYLFQQASERTYDLSSLRAVYVNSAPFPPEVKRMGVELFGPKVWEYYGTTEVGLISVLKPENLLDHASTVGQVVPGVTVKVMADEETEAAPNVPGVLYIASPLTSGTLRKTDDVGVLDADGYLTINGRATDLIISGGVNIYPREIEMAVSSIPGIQEISVVGMPDEDWGERVVAAVVLENEVDWDEETLREEMRQHLDARKVPKEIVFLTEIPRNPAGKIDRNQLKALIASGVDGEGNSLHPESKSVNPGALALQGSSLRAVEVLTRVKG